MPSQYALELQDSEVSACAWQDRHFKLHFSAGHVHRSPTSPGAVDEVGFLSSLEWICLNASEVHHDPGCLGTVAEGCLQLGGQRLERVPLPYETREALVLTLRFSNGAVCRVVAQGLSLQAGGESRFVDWFMC